MTGYTPTYLSFFENTLPHHAQTQGNPLHCCHNLSYTIHRLINDIDHTSEGDY